LSETTAPLPDPAPATSQAPVAAVPAAPVPHPPGSGRWIAAGAAVLAALATGATVLAWNTQQRVKSLEAELVKRQADSGSQATEARTLARQAEITAREAAAKLALLEALLKQPQRVLSKAQLQERLYDWSGGEPESNTLEVHVHHLRRKIDPGIVRTVRGVGYALGAPVEPAGSEGAA
jgi:DNA-binding response OmpR family regulator